MNDAVPNERGAYGQTRFTRWFERRRDDWADIDARRARVERDSHASPEDVLAVVRAYPEVARDLAIARRTTPNGRLTRRLEHTYLELHHTLFRVPGSLKHSLPALFLQDAPAVARSLWQPIIWVVLLFVGAIAAGAWLVATFPALIRLFASEQMISHVQQGQLWTDGLLNIMPSSVLAVEIFTNNIVVALFALTLGAAYGLGTIYIIGMNGLMLGGVFAFTARYGLAGRLFEFVCAHGFVELSVICMAGAIGVSIGEALARPGALPRGAAFQQAVARGGKLAFVLVVFLVGAGMIEGFVSPNPVFTLPVRLAIGLSYFALFLFVVTGAAGRLFLSSARRARK